jgi:hypothetical protein
MTREIVLPRHDLIPVMYGAGISGIDMTIARITPGDTTVILRWKIGKRKDQLHFVDTIVRQNKFVGIGVPKTVRVGQGYIELERARGINLDTSNRSMVGPDIEKAEKANIHLIKSDVRYHAQTLFHIPVKKRLYGALRYMYFVSALHKKGFYMGDHKSDSVFVDANGFVTITDPANIGERGVDPNPLQLMGEEEKRYTSGNNLSRVLAAFMHRGVHVLPKFSESTVSDEFTYALPVGFQKIIKEVQSRRLTAEQIVQEFQEWMDGESDLSPTREVIEQRMNNFWSSIRAPGFKYIDDLERIMEPYYQRWKNMTNTELDIFAAQTCQNVYAEIELMQS